MFCHRNSYYSLVMTVFVCEVGEREVIALQRLYCSQLKGQSKASHATPNHP